MRFRGIRAFGVCAALGLGAGAACAPGVALGPGEPAEDAAAVAEALQAETVPPGPQRADFAWELDEAGARFRGRGVARYVAPERFRLDLFGPRGETYLAAALVDGEPRVPPMLEERMGLPSPALLWATVGVVSPPPGAELAGASISGAETVIRYTHGGDVFEYRAEGDRLTGLRRMRRGGVAESVELGRDEAGALRRAQYRDWAAFRSLTLTVEEQREVPSFPDDVWSPPGTRR